MGTNRVVLEALGHLLSVLCQHHAVADKILEGRLVEQDGRDHHQAVEPTPGLINTYRQSKSAYLKSLCA